MAETACPCCGRPLVAAPTPAELVTLPLGDSEREVLGYYVKEYPRPLVTQRVVDRLWQLDPNGGPAEPRNGISVRVHNINRVLKPLGWRIRQHGRAMRRLERLEA